MNIRRLLTLTPVDPTHLLDDLLSNTRLLEEASEIQISQLREIAERFELNDDTEFFILSEDEETLLYGLAIIYS